MKKDLLVGDYGVVMSNPGFRCSSISRTWAMVHAWMGWVSVCLNAVELKPLKLRRACTRFEHPVCSAPLASPREMRATVLKGKVRKQT